MTSPNMRTAWVAALAGILALAGQVAWRAQPENTWAWPGWLLTVGALLVWLMGQQPNIQRSLQRIPIATLWFSLALVLALSTYTVDYLWQQQGRTDYSTVLALWVLSMVAFVVGVSRPEHWANLPTRARQFWASYRWEVLAVLALTAVAAGWRFYDLGVFPRVIDGDEGRVGQYALATNNSRLASPFHSAENFGGLYLQAINLGLDVAGANATGLRLVPAVGGTLVIPALYLLARALAGRGVAVLAVALLALSHAHTHFSRIAAVAYIQGTWLVPLELYFFYTGLQRRSAVRLALGGLILGVHFNVYLTAQVVAGMAAIYWLCLWLWPSAAFRALRQSAWAFWAGIGVAVLPYALLSVRQPGEFFARLSADGSFQSGWIAQRMAETGQSAPVLMFERVLQVFMALVQRPALDFYGASIPLLDVFTAALMMVGLAYAVRHTANPALLLLNGYFWSLTVSIGVLAIPPSADTYRMLAALPAAMLAAALGAWQVWRALHWVGEAGRLQRWASAAVLMGVVGLVNTQAYTNVVGNCRFGLDTQTRFASYLGNYLRALPRDQNVYLLSDEVYRHGTHGSTMFLSDNYAVTNWNDPVEAIPLLAETVIVAPPSRIAELEAWWLQQPRGQLHREYDCANPMLVSYELER